RDVQLWTWPAAESDPRRSRVAGTRARVLAEAMRPAATAERWQEAQRHFDAVQIDSERLAIALQDFRRIDCPTPAEEAQTIALLMREVLEEEGKRAALVTADRDRARRVAAALRRWDIEVDDSAGMPLAETSPGSVLLLLAEAVAADFAPVPLLSLLKHPLVAGGESSGAFRDTVRALERATLRGPRPMPGLVGLRSMLAAPPAPPARDRLGADGRASLDRFVARLERMTEPFAALAHRNRVDLATLVDAHIACAETLATSDEQGGARRLWAGEAGEAAALFIDELRQAAPSFPDLALGDYPALLAALMRGIAVRPNWGRHPRLAIWGPLEARLQHVERMILGGLNENSWPPELATDAWFSRAMRSAFGLPPPERRLGLSAHDFAQACTAPEVFLTRSIRNGGTP